ncbi:hypothetical protein FMM05_08235 [Flavobacterium zepuense]|uniref:Lipocalin-like domain-containing protein n=1 Tax=Flavobacterium zepuense TaxID=2593302 RepID=A0A552V474_9FLAO|nr:lipocalin family protein [Flavobacterium zepuense]TRW25284.1 hypothetical protein FMM05_08235 [Flavobacterium zepuense]
MKKINAKALVLLVMMLCLTACSSDDDAVAPILQDYKQLILGKWFIKGGTINGGAFQNYVHDCPSNRDYQEFFADGDIKFVGYNTDCEANDTQTDMWFVEGETLNITSFDPIVADMAYTIVTLNENELV